jgi:hypothetical protein
VVRGAAGVGSLPATGAGVRMMWFPARHAFRAGRVEGAGATYWDLANVGQGSAANTFAAGLWSVATGAESVAFGNNATSSAERAFSFNGTASGVGAVAMGPSGIAGGLAAIVLGSSIANGSFGVAIGLQNSASGNFSVAVPSTTAPPPRPTTRGPASGEGKRP